MCLLSTDKWEKKIMGVQFHYLFCLKAIPKIFIHVESIGFYSWSSDVRTLITVGLVMVTMYGLVMVTTYFKCT